MKEQELVTQTLICTPLSVLYEGRGDWHTHTRLHAHRLFAVLLCRDSDKSLNTKLQPATGLEVHHQSKGLVCFLHIVSTSQILISLSCHHRQSDCRSCLHTCTQQDMHVNKDPQQDMHVNKIHSNSTQTVFPCFSARTPPAICPPPSSPLAIRLSLLLAHNNQLKHACQQEIRSTSTQTIFACFLAGTPQAI